MRVRHDDPLAVATRALPGQPGRREPTVAVARPPHRAEPTVAPARPPRRRAPTVPFALALLALSVTGCPPQLMTTPNLYAHAPLAVWDSVPPALRTCAIDVLYATDRAPRVDRQGHLRYGYDRSASLAFGVCTVQVGDERLDWPELCRQSTRQDRTVGLPLSIANMRERVRLPDTPWPRDYDKNPHRPPPEVVAAHEAGVAEFQALVAERLALTPRKEAFVYVHGFNNSLEDAAYVMAGLWHFFTRVGVPIIYSYPSGDRLNLRAYNYDRESGRFTIYHMRQFLEALAGTPELERIHLVAHSRGAIVLTDALRELNIKHRASPGVGPVHERLKIGQVLLAAPDMAYEVARQRLETEQMFEAWDQLTVYTSRGDLALRVASWLFAGAVRLGTLGLLQLPQHERLELARIPGLVLIDADVRGDLVGHAYFHADPAVSSDVVLLLRDRRPPGAPGRPLERGDDPLWIIRDGYPHQALTPPPDEP